VNVWHTWATTDPDYRQHRTADEDRIREALGVCRDTYTAADPLTVEWEPYATVDEGNSAAVIVWLAGAIVAALLVFVAVVVMRRG